MKHRYILGIDQSTQGTKAVLLDENSDIAGRCDLPHDQIVNEKGWVEHDPLQIYGNVIAATKAVIDQTNMDSSEIVGIGITNQRETAVVWDRDTGMPIMNAIVWQCARAASICKELQASENLIRERTGLNLSPYFSAAKIAWVLRNVDKAKEKSDKGRLAYGTMDSWLVYKLTNGQSFKTDYSNASRTELFDISRLRWDEEICGLFGINTACLAEVCDSNACYGYTDLEGVLDKPVPIHCVIGDSHGALFGQNCRKKGMVKATYGTGSSVMMNIGREPFFSSHGIVTSLAWGMDGSVEYVLEGNINYSGAVISWLKDSLGILVSSGESEEYARRANPADLTYLVPAFSGLGAPYWDSEASAMICGMSRNTGKAEIIKAALDSIAYQVTDIIQVMETESGISVEELRVDGGATKNSYLMQLQSDLLNYKVKVPAADELSVLGAAYAAGMAMEVFAPEQIFLKRKTHSFDPEMDPQTREFRLEGWKKAIRMVLLK